MFSSVGPLLYRAAQCVAVVDVSRLLVLDQRGAPAIAVDDRCTFRFLSADEVRTIAEDDGNDLTSASARRLASGRDFCFGAFDGDVLVSYLWLALGSVEAEQNRGRHPHSGIALSFGQESAFVYNAFTRVAYRRQGLYGACLTRALAALKSRGVSRLLITADWTNRAALSACRRAGFRQVGLLRCYGWPGFLRTSGPAQAARLGIQLGRRATVHR